MYIMILVLDSQQVYKKLYHLLTLMKTLVLWICTMMVTNQQH